MPKRKREVPEGVETEHRKPGIRQLRAEQKVEHGQKVLTRAFKTAKGFERQKLGRRQKIAKGDDLVRIAAEVAALKTLDLHAVAISYLNKSLLKFKAVATSPDLPRSLLKPPHQTSDTAALNILARLCNSNPVREALAPVQRDVQRALGIDVEGPGAKAAKRLRTKDSDKVKEEDEAKDTDSDSSSTVDQGDSSTGRHATKAESDDEFDDDELAALDARIAPSDDEEDDDELDYRRASDEEDNRDQANDAADLLSLDDTDEDEDASEDELRQPSKGKLSKRAPSPTSSESPPPQPKPTKSAFLPSLTLGGYISGSDNDDDPFDEFDDSAKPKKNRRGQRARQAIWEKKFGQGAKHVQNDSGIAAKGKTSDKRADGWDAKRGATDSSSRFGRSRGGGQSRAVDRGNAKGATEEKKKHRDDEGSLHPSWLAAKKAKEAKSAPVAFQGKKITFD